MEPESPGPSPAGGALRSLCALMLLMFLGDWNREAPHICHYIRQGGGGLTSNFQTLRETKDFRLELRVRRGL
jgi:hypothetical protein